VRLGTRLTALVVLASALPLVVGCSNLESQAAMVAASKFPLPTGYTFAGIDGGQFSIDFQNSEYTAHFVKKTVDLSPAKECAAAINFGQSLGATHWSNDVDFPPKSLFPIDGHEAHAQIGCVNKIGWAWDDTGALNPGRATSVYTMWGKSTSLLPGTAVPIIIEFNVGEGRIHFTVWTWMTYNVKKSPEIDEWTWDEAVARLDAGRLFFFTALDALGQYRVAHPKASSESLSEIKSIFDTAKLDPTGGKIDVVRDGKTGEIYAHLIPHYGNWLDLCVSLAPFNPDYFGVADPGFGYGVGYGHGWRPKNEFASGVHGSCPPVDPNVDADSAP